MKCTFCRKKAIAESASVFDSKNMKLMYYCRDDLKRYASPYECVLLFKDNTVYNMGELKEKI